ncbi:hypothetical protein ZWY2020_052312 [Hordeum vulgare]|nr:hypothetical protein ZWY2020_008650 [Hordeum vulgare]KAI4996970.1 hypothetical protein ZWY2020_052312 [Hordeum vulgare]
MSVSSSSQFQPSPAQPSCSKLLLSLTPIYYSSSASLFSSPRALPDNRQPFLATHIAASSHLVTDSEANWRRVETEPHA